MITIGIDPHESSLTAVAVDPTGRDLGTVRLPVTENLGAQLLAWAQSWQDRHWAVDGATDLVRGVAQLLATAEEQVLDVPAKLAARARLLGSGSARKTDVTDAASVAAVAQRNVWLRPVRAEDHTVIMRLLSDRRDDLVAERTRTMNRLHVLLRDLHPGGAKRDLSTRQAGALLRTIRPLTAPDQLRKSLARDLLADVRRLELAIKGATKTLTAALQENGSSLTGIHDSARSRPPRSSRTLAMSVGFPAGITSPATAAPHRLRPPVATFVDTGSPALATANSTPPSTSWRSTRLATMERAVTTTGGSSPRPRRPRRGSAKPQPAADQRDLQAPARRPAAHPAAPRLTHRGAIKSRRSALTSGDRHNA